MSGKRKMWLDAATLMLWGRDISFSWGNEKKISRLDFRKIMKCLNPRKKTGYMNPVPRKSQNLRLVPKQAWVSLEERPRQTVCWLTRTKIKTKQQAKKHQTSNRSLISPIFPALIPKQPWHVSPKWPEISIRPVTSPKRWFSFLMRLVTNSIRKIGRNYCQEEALPLICRARASKRMINIFPSSKSASITK